MADVYTNGTGGGKWHDASTWDGGAVPGTSDRVIVQAGDTLTVEGVCECGNGLRSTSNSEANAQLVIKPGGTLKASRTADSELRVKGQIYGHASSSAAVIMDWGTETDPIPAGVTAIINLNAEGSTHVGYYYGIYLYYGNSSHFASFYAKSAVERRRGTYLVRAYSAGSTQIEVADATNWQPGDKLRLIPQYQDSDSANPENNHEYETVEIASISGNVITLTAGTTYAHGYDNPKDVEAGVVVNLTSNVVITGGGDDRPMYGIRVYRSNVEVQDVEFAYANNDYNYVRAALQVVYGGIYDTTVKINRVAFWSDSRNYARHSYSQLYLYSVNKRDNVEVNDLVGVGIRNSGTYRLYYPFVFYYGGRNTIANDLVAISGENYRGEYGFSAYQQPVTLNRPKAVGFHWGYNLNNNVNPDVNDGWAIGCMFAYQVYNGTAVFNDMRVRWNNRLSHIINEWRGMSTMNRPDYEDRHLAKTYAGLDLVSRGNPIPDGNEVHLVDVQNDPNKQAWYYSFGTKIWNSDVTRDDPHSIEMASLSDIYPTRHEREFEAATGDAMLVGVYVRNLSASYVGTLTLSIWQGSTQIVSQDFDLTTLTADQWTLLSVSGTAQKTMKTTFRMEYRGNGGQIALTDFVQPFTADQKAQAMAVWAAAVADNHAAGSFGEYIQQTLAKDQTVTDSRDHVESHGDGAWSTADTSALALEATVQAVKSRTDLIPNDPARSAEVQQVAADVWARAMEGTLTYEQGLRIMLAVLAGKVTGAGTGTERFRDQADTKDRVVSHVDSNGNRTSVEVDGS